MHRGRNRSRKPVESQTMTQSSSSTVTSLTVNAGSSSSNATGDFQNLTTTNTYGNPQGTGSGTDQTHYDLESIPYGIPSKEYRYGHLYYISHCFFAWRKENYLSLESFCLAYFKKEPILVPIVVFDADL